MRDSHPKTTVLFKNALRSIFKYRYLFLISLVVVTFFTIIGGVVLFKSRGSAIKQARVEAKNISYSLDQNIQNSFNKADLALVSISKMAAHRDLYKSKNEVEKFQILDFYKEKLPEVSAFRIADSNGHAVFKNEENKNASIEVYDREYFQFHQNEKGGNLFISKPIKSKVDGKQIITLSRRIESDQKKFLGIVYAVIALDHFREIISAIDVGPNGNISLVSIDDSVILYRFPEDKIFIGQKISLHQEAQELKRQKKMSGEWEQLSSVDFKMKTFGIRMNYTYGYLISSGLAESDYLRPWHVNFYSGILLLVLLIISMLFAVVKYISVQEQVEMQKNQMDASARKIAVGRIASGVAHEINNPLAIIKGKSEIARMLLNEKQEKNLEVINKLLDIEKMVQRAAKIVQGMQILGLEREEGFEAQSLQPIITSALEILSQKLTDLNIEIRVESASDMVIDCNRSDMTEVFIHLISNSIDAIKNLNESERWIEISCANEKGLLIIKVTDSGQGIPIQEVASIMDPFFTTKPPGSGAGLGLSVTEAILRNHGGTLAHNRNSTNTQFVIKIKKDGTDILKSA